MNSTLDSALNDGQQLIVPLLRSYNIDPEAVEFLLNHLKLAEGAAFSLQPFKYIHDRLRVNIPPGGCFYDVVCPPMNIFENRQGSSARAVVIRPGGVITDLIPYHRCSFVEVIGYHDLPCARRTATVINQL